MFQFLLTILLAIDIDWGDITEPIYRLFMGNETVEGIFAGDSMLLGIFIFIILFILTLMFGLGMLVGSVVIIPSLFAIFNYIPGTRALIGILAGLIFGLALHKLVRR